MTKTTQRKQVCQQIRKVALSLSKEQKIGYGCADKGLEYVSWYQDKDKSVHILTGWCGICSIAIAQAFRKNDFDAHVRMGKLRGLHGHCWVHSGGRNYDVTAIQFGLYPKIIIVSDHYLYPSPYYTVDPENREYYFSEWHEAYQPTNTRINQLLENVDE